MKFIILTVLLKFCLCVQLPSTFKKCDRKQDNFKTCLNEAVEGAIFQLREAKPEVTLPSMEPLQIPEMSIQPGTSAMNLQQNYKNMKMYNLTRSSSMRTNMDFEKKILTLYVDYPEVFVTFEYELNGRIFTFPINGKGPGNFIFRSVKLIQTFVLEEYDRRNKKHYKVLDAKTNFTEIGNVYIRLENVFRDEALNDNINNVLNDNWLELVADVKGGYEQGGAEVLKIIVNRFFARVSISELFGDV